MSSKINSIMSKPTEKDVKRRLESFLERYKVSGQGVYHTHCAFGPPWGKYNIPDENAEEFNELYCDALGKIDLHYVERPKKVGPLLIDLDFKFGSDHGERQYREDDIKYVIGNANMIIKNYFKLNYDDLNAYVTEKGSPSVVQKDDETTYKDGFHIVYPHLAITEEVRYLLINELKETIIKSGGFSHLPYINDIDDVFDTSVVKNNGWMMYGSRKNTGKYYVLSHIFKYTFEEELKSKYRSRDLVKILSNRQYGNDDVLPFKDGINIVELNQKIKKIKEKHFKEVESENIFEDGDVVDEAEENVETGEQESEETAEIRKEVMDKLKAANEMKDTLNLANNDVSMARKLVGILSKTRASDYNSWIHVGWALHNISKSLIDAWKLFSKKCPKKYNEKVCEDIWKKAKDEGFSISSLHLWARRDNPEEYSKILRQSIKELFIEAETGTEYDVAKVVYQLYKPFYKCTSLKHHTWYEFQDNLWVEVEDAYTLGIKLSEELSSEFAMVASYYMSTMAADVEGGKDTYYKKALGIFKIVKNLKSSAFKERVIKECSRLFYEPSFEEKLDSNKNLIGFSNGIYDLEHACFRKATPDDCVSMSTGYDYEEYSYDHPYIKEIEEYFSKVQREVEMRNYVLTLLSSYLDGHTKSQKFIIWTGSGSNGKSTTVTFFQFALGEYCGTFPNTVLTRKKGNSGAASPELADKRGKRFVVIQEPEADDQINVGFMKELTGSDVIYARPLFKDPIEFRPQFKLLLTCNKLPFIPSTDGGTWRRLRVTPFESEFTDHPTKPHQFHKDDELMEKFELWKSAFIWLLINKWYPIYKKSGLSEPDKVKQHTNNYKKQSDVFLEFIEENLEITKSTKDFESLDILYSTFKIWFNESNPVKCNISKKELQEYFKNNGYNTDKNHLYGAKFKSEKEME